MNIYEIYLKKEMSSKLFSGLEKIADERNLMSHNILNILVNDILMYYSYNKSLS